MGVTVRTDKLLTGRVALPALLALTALPFVLPWLVLQIVLTFAMVPVIFAALKAPCPVAGARVVHLCNAAGFSMSMLFGLDRLIHGGSATVITFAAGTLSAAMFFAATLAIAHARRPDGTLEGIADGFAALAGMVALQWQWHALEPGATVASIGAHTTPFIAIFLCLCILSVYWGLALDKRQDRWLLFALIAASGLATVGTGATQNFSLPDAPLWAMSCWLMSAYVFFCYFNSPSLPRIYLPEPPRRRLIAMRWFGPACVLAATPLMILIFVVRDAKPTVAVGLVCLALTALALWRGGHMVREREKARRELVGERRLGALVEHAADAIVILDADLRVTYASGGADGLLGGRGERLVGMPVDALFDPEDAALLESAIGGLTGEGSSTCMERDVRLGGQAPERRWATVRVTNHAGLDTIGGWVLNIHEVTERKRAEQSLEHLAHYDALTGLPNRAALRQRLAEAIAGPGTTSILFCDLDGFKAVNDKLGHECGDEVLRAVAGRWSGLLRSTDLLGRWGGDEFLVICPETGTRSSAPDIARRLADALQAPLHLTSTTAEVGVSVGVASHVPGESVDALIARADEAMYCAKRTRAR